MKLSDESIDDRRRLLAAQISRQRGELAEVYRNLERPIHYAEYGMRSFGFFRQNPWVFVAVPAALKVASTLLGLRGKKSKPSSSRRQDVEHRPRSFGGHVLKWGGHGWRLFRLYRRMRHLLP